MATAVIAKRATTTLGKTSDLQRPLFIFLGGLSTTTTSSSSSVENTAVGDAVKKPRCKKKKNLFKVVQFLPNWGIGYHMVKTHWAEVSYEITKINLYKVIDVMPLMKTLTFNVICTLIFGVERGARRDTLVHLFERVMDGMLVLPINLPFTRFNRSLGARLKAGGIIKELIHEKREKMKNNHEISSDQDLITSLLSICDEAGSPLLTDDEIEDNCAVAMIAGHDTTSTLLTFLIKLLAEHPHVYELVLNEQEEISRGKKKSGDPLMWDDLAKMKYTWRVATEALRMYPPVMFSFRQVLKDIEMEGYVIPKGWQVFWAGCMTQLDESIYPDPYKFNPSRYEKHGATPPHTFVAFGGGARTCPGNEFARIETLTMIHYLVTGFNWKLCLEENIMSRDPMPAFNQGLPIQIQIKKPWNRTVSPIP